MDVTKFEGILTEKEEFLYSDCSLAPLPHHVHVSMAKNGKPGIQLLIKTSSKSVQLVWEGDGFVPEWFCMRDVPVEYNTGDGEQQGGAMVLMEKTEEKPAYVTKKAPFFVYDRLERCEQDEIMVHKGLAAIYLCLKAKEGTPCGIHKLSLCVKLEEGVYCCDIEVRLYDVSIPEAQFSVTNWFSEDAICRFHHVKKGTGEYVDMVRQYARAMRRMHQNTFFIQLDERCVKTRRPYTFSFDHLTPVISAFFEEGMKTMELGVLLDRGVLSDGTPNMYTDKFTCAMAPSVLFESEEGYEITVRFVKDLAQYLEDHGWEKNILFHVHDEPDIHYKDEETLEARRRQYYLAANILRKYIPSVRTIEAVDTARFQGGIDIWVPGTAGYERRKEEFDQRVRLGEALWTYVCCGPEGHWLNRFLDFALLKGRLLFWGCAKNRMTGFLHWGFNQFPEGMDPEYGTSCPNHTGIGTHFPCGDSFLVYPGEIGPHIGMRMESQRRGVEDVALLQCLREKNERLHDELVEKVFVNFYTYQDDPSVFQEVYEELLKALEE